MHIVERSTVFHPFSRRWLAGVASCIALATPVAGEGAAPITQNVVQFRVDQARVDQARVDLAYADLVELAESAPLVALAEIHDMVRLPADRARAAPAGYERVYVEARGIEAWAGVMPAGQEVRYLADVPVDARGRIDNWKKRRVVLFAQPVAGGNGEIRLIAGDAQMGWTPALEARLRPIIAEIAAPGRPPRITGVSMALYQAGNLAGEGDTQIFLNTSSGVPAAIVVQHKAGQPVNWAITFSEVADAAGRPPARETLTWYRLACALPEMLPVAANVADTQEGKDHAMGDYLLVKRDLGACGRTRGL